jgi:hypothetical protein
MRLLRGSRRWWPLRRSCAVSLSRRWRRIRLRGGRIGLRRGRIGLRGWSRIAGGRRRRVGLRGWSAIRCCRRWPVRVLRRGWRVGLGRGAGTEIRTNGGTEWIHAFRRAKASAICSGRGCEATRIRRSGMPGILLRRRSVTGSRGRRRGAVATRSRGRRSGPRRRGRAVRLRGGRWRRLPPSGRGLRRSGRLRMRSRLGSAVARRRRCRGGQWIAAGQAEFAGGLIRRAAPRAHVHVKTPELELRLRSPAGASPASIPGLPRLYAVNARCARRRQSPRPDPRAGSGAGPRAACSRKLMAPRRHSASWAPGTGFWLESAPNSAGTVTALLRPCQPSELRHTPRAVPKS